MTFFRVVTRQCLWVFFVCRLIYVPARFYSPGEAFDILRGTWFYESTWQPVQCEYADRIEHEHLQRFHGHKMADYVWDASTSTRLEKQVGVPGPINGGDKKS